MTIIRSLKGLNKCNVWHEEALLSSSIAISLRIKIFHNDSYPSKFVSLSSISFLKVTEVEHLKFCQTALQKEHTNLFFFNNTSPKMLVTNYYVSNLWQFKWGSRGTIFFSFYFCFLNYTKMNTFTSNSNSSLSELLVKIF